MCKKIRNKFSLSDKQSMVKLYLEEGYSYKAIAKKHSSLLKEVEYLRAENAFLKKLDALIREAELQGHGK